jgi:hypothetical protein
MNHSSDISAFSFARYRLTLQASEELHLPRFKGSALRGVFGHTFYVQAADIIDIQCRNLVAFIEEDKKYRPFISSY